LRRRSGRRVGVSSSTRSENFKTSIQPSINGDVLSDIKTTDGKKETYLSQVKFNRELMYKNLQYMTVDIEKLEAALQLFKVEPSGPTPPISPDSSSILIDVLNSLRDVRVKIEDLQIRINRIASELTQG